MLSPLEKLHKAEEGRFVLAFSEMVEEKRV